MIKQSHEEDGPIPVSFDRKELVVGLLDLTKILSAGTSLFEKMSGLCQSVVSLIRCDRSSIFLLQEDYYRAKFNHGNPPDIAVLFPQTRFSPKNPLIAQAMESRTYIMVNDVKCSSLLDQRLVEVIRIKAIVLAPLLELDGRPLGFITAEYNENAGVFTSLESTLLLGMAKLAEIILQTDRINAENKHFLEALRESEDRFRTLFEQANDGMLLADAETKRFTLANRQIERMLGYSEEELHQLTVADIHPAADLPAVLDQFAKLVRQEITVAPEVPVRRKDGSVFYADINASVIRLQNRDGLLGIFRDISERRQAENEIRQLNVDLERRVIDRTAQLEASNNELEAFAYSVSHDLRAPLRAVDGFSRILQEEWGDKLDDEGRRLLDIIRINTRHMDQLIVDLLLLSRVTRTEIQPSRIDMTLLANSIYREMASPETQKKFSFSIGPLPDAQGDPTLMKQVWANLLGNALKYSLPKDNRKIEVGGRNEEGVNLYYVKDSGVGFNPDYTHKLFGVFQRLHKAEDFEGTGIGLAIVQRIIHRHGGQVWAEGKVGEGATFWFSIPSRQ